MLDMPVIFLDISTGEDPVGTVSAEAQVPTKDRPPTRSTEWRPAA